MAEHRVAEPEQEADAAAADAEQQNNQEVATAAREAKSQEVKHQKSTLVDLSNNAAEVVNSSVSLTQQLLSQETAGTAESTKTKKKKKKI